MTRPISFTAADKLKAVERELVRHDHCSQGSCVEYFSYPKFNREDHNQDSLDLIARNVIEGIDVQ